MKKNKWAAWFLWECLRSFLLRMKELVSMRRLPDSHASSLWSDSCPKGRVSKWYRVLKFPSYKEKWFKLLIFASWPHQLSNGFLHRTSWFFSPFKSTGSKSLHTPSHFLSSFLYWKMPSNFPWGCREVCLKKNSTWIELDEIHLVGGFEPRNYESRCDKILQCTNERL